MTLTIEPDGASLVVSDGIEQRQCVFRMPTAAPVTPADDEEFYFPVDAAVRVDGPAVTLGNYVATFVRDEAGDIVAAVDDVDEVDLPPGVYSIELDHAIKLYVRVRGRVHIETTGMTTTVETDGDLLVGARSRHNNPAGTITTTREPRHLMRAVSALSSSLKTTSVERSYPTLRGHPPEIELGDELHVPAALTPPETGVRIEVPPYLRFVYPAASLAFYLGADLVPGATPRIVGEGGFEHSLDGAAGFERTVEEVLKQVVLFDCVARTEGFYRLNLTERHEVESVVDLDWATLYDRTLTEQLRTYLSVPFDSVEKFVPEWKTTTYLAPTPENVELLPFLVDDLAVVRLPMGETTSPSEVETSSLLAFTRSEAAFTRSVSSGAVSTRSSSAGQTTAATSLVQPAETDSFEIIWAADDVPVGATKASVEGYRNSLDHSPSEEIGVTVVVNDAEMAEEGAVASDVYGDDTGFPFDLRVYENLSTDRLRAVLETDRDFFHYVGHIEADGFECADGRLDARELESVGVDSFFLNACASYEQGMALLESGAVGGVVTISEVLNSGATRVGKSMVRLLNHGFPLRAALDVAKGESFVGGQYVVVGDGDVDVVQRESLGATVVQLSKREDEYGVTFRTYPTSDLTVGGFTRTAADPQSYSLAPGSIGEFVLSDEELVELLEKVNDPVRYDGQLSWSYELEF